MPRPVAALALAALLVAAAPALAQPAPAQPAPAPAAAPSEADEARVEAFMRAVSAPEARAGWIADNVSPDTRMPAAEYPQLLAALGATPGGLRLASWSRIRSGLRLIVESAAGRQGRVTLYDDAAHPGRVQGIGTAALPTPWTGEPPAGPLAREALRAAVAERVRFAAERDDFSGVVLVMRGDEVIHQSAVGLANRDFGVANTADTRFHLGSMDKMFTAVAIAQLVEQGRLSLDTRLVEVLPDYPNREAAEAITIRHLLSHRAGLGGLFDRPAYDRFARHDRVAELLPVFAAEPLAYVPGEGAGYSNEGFVVLGAVIERLTGMSWYDYVAARVFAPAGMTDTGYDALDEVGRNRAVGYRFDERDPLGFGERRPNFMFPSLGWRGNSCGGGYSTAADMVRFLTALREGRLVDPALVETFASLEPDSIGRYGLGFQVTSVGDRTIRGHSGGGAASGINGDARAVWETGYVYAVLGNYDAPFAQTLGDDIGRILATQD